MLSIKQWKVKHNIIFSLNVLELKLRAHLNIWMLSGNYLLS